MPGNPLILGLLIESEPTALARVLTVLRQRGVDLVGLSAAPAAEVGLVHVTVKADSRHLAANQIAKYLNRIPAVRKIVQADEPRTSVRELAILVLTPSQPTLLLALSYLKRGLRVLHRRDDSFVVELSAESVTVDAFLAAVDPADVISGSRSGPVLIRLPPHPRRRRR